jgi:hypothetical protein
MILSDHLPSLARAAGPRQRLGERFEPAVGFLQRSRSSTGGCGDVQVWHTCCDRWCPPSTQGAGVLRTHRRHGASGDVWIADAPGSLPVTRHGAQPPDSARPALADPPEATRPQPQRPVHLSRQEDPPRPPRRCHPRPISRQSANHPELADGRCRPASGSGPSGFGLNPLADRGCFSWAGARRSAGRCSALRPQGCRPRRCGSAG